MRLFAKKNSYLVITYLIIFSTIGSLFYFLFHYLEKKDLKDKLYYHKEYVIKELSRSDSIITYQKFSRNTFDIKEIPNIPGINADQISDTVINYNDSYKKHFTYQQLKFYCTIRGKHYQVCVRRPLIEESILFYGLLELTLFAFFILVFSLFITNFLITRFVWKPFTTIINNIKNYSIGFHQNISFPETNIYEFNELIKVLNMMTEKIRNDYLILKKYTENISHEIQTPLSIIKSKLELLLQKNNLANDEIKLLSSCYDAVNTLSDISEALTLLTKIENGQYNEVSQINLEEIIKYKLNNYEELIDLKEIKVKIIQNQSIHSVRIDKRLAEVLIENLINNSIKHNTTKGEIIIEFSEHKIAFVNTGTNPNIDPRKLFERFSRANSTTMGLGLAIVKEICDKFNIQINYQFTSPYHEITLLF